MIAPDRPWLVGTAVAYLVAVSALGLWAASRTRSTRDFFIAGQRLGLWVTGLATMSTAFSGFVFVGGPGLTYRIGLASLGIVLPLGFTSGMLCWVLGARLRRLASRREIYTVPDAIQARYGSRSVTGLAALAVLLGTLAYLGLQIQVLALVLQTVLGAETLLPALLLGLGVLVTYSLLGGMVAGAYTDVLQGGLMMVTAVAVFVHALGVAGGWDAALSSVAASPEFGPEFLAPLGRVPATTLFGFVLVFGVGVLGQPQLLHKFYMIRDEAKLRFLPLVLAASQAVCVLVWLGLGLAVPALVAQRRLAPLANPDDATGQYLLHFAPEALAGLVVAGILAAIMSTADSLINIGSAALVRDLPRALGRPAWDGLSAARLATLVVSGVAAAVAWTWSDLIALLGTFAFGTFGAALAPALAVGFNWSRVTGAAAGASIATGLGLNLGLEFLAQQSWFAWLPRPPLPAGVLPAAVSLAASFSVLFLITALSRPGSPGVATGEMRALIEG